MQEEIAGVPTQIILKNYVRAHLEECLECQQWETVGREVPIVAHIFREHLVRELRVSLPDLVPIVRQELKERQQRPTYQQLLSLVRDYYFLTLESAPHTFWKQKDLYDEQARAILEKQGEPTEREWEAEEEDEEEPFLTDEQIAFIKDTREHKFVE